MNAEVICMELYLVRHGESCGNTGADDSADPCLTRRGQTQARLLGQSLRTSPPDRILCSPLLRAVQTAQIAAQALAYTGTVELSADLMETRPIVGYSGRPDEELRSICPNAVYPDRFSLPDETPADALHRAQRVISALQKRFADARVLVVAHGQFNTSLLLAAVGAQACAAHFSQGNACVNRLSLSDTQAKVFYINRLEHLPDALRT